MPTVQVVIPVFNEEATIEKALERVAAAALPRGWSKRMIIVDDASTDSTPAALERFVAEFGSFNADGDGAATGVSQVIVTRHERNRGKGAALQTGFDLALNHRATRARGAALDQHDDDDAGGDGGADRDLGEPGDIVIVQDADLEYDPADYPALLEPIVAGRTRVVYGTRFGRHRRLSSLVERIHAAGNRGLTALSNVATGYRLRDMECCYKVFDEAALRRIRPYLSEARFGIEPQITAALACAREPIVEAPIRYTPRSFQQGKKIKWGDGFRAVWVIYREWARAANVIERTGAGACSSGAADDA